MRVLDRRFFWFTPLARAQFAAVARMRWRVQLNLLRSRQGRIEALARLAATIFFVLLWLLLAAGFGYAALEFTVQGQFLRLTWLFWALFFLWQGLPIMIAAAQGGSDLTLLLRFPVSFESYCLLYLFSGLFDLPSQMGFLTVAGIGIGVVAARPSLFFWVLLALALFSFFNLLLTRMIFSWIEHWLARRRSREILGMIFLAFFLCLQLLNPAYHLHIPGLEVARRAHLLSMIETFQWFFPAGLASSALGYGAAAHPWQAAGSLTGTLVYAIAAAGLLRARLLSQFRGESVGEGTAVPQSKRLMRQRTRPAGVTTTPPIWKNPVFAILSKELRYLSRSGVLLFGLVTPVVFLFASGGSMRSYGGVALSYAFPLAVAYAFLPLTRLICNSLGAEGSGIQLYFLAPTPFRTIVLAKNLLQCGLLSIEILLAGAIAIARFGMPDSLLLISTICWLSFAVPANLAVGNLLSIYLAYPMTLTRLTREQGSVVNGLLSLLAQLVIFGIGAAVYLWLGRAGHAALVAPTLLLLGAAGLSLWLVIWSRSGNIAWKRRDRLLARLVSRG